MKKYITLFISFLIFSITITAQETKKIKINKTYSDFYIVKNQEKTFEFFLKENTYYSIIVMQKGIDVELFLKDKNGKILLQRDTPNGQFGPEKIVCSPETSGFYLLTVKPFLEEENSKKGDYTIFINEISKDLEKISYSKLIQDFEILKNAYIETNIGLWYNTFTQFDSICNIQKSKITQNMNALDFYKIAAPIVAFTKEGHSNINVSDNINDYKKQNGKYFPFIVKIIDKKVYLLNDFDDFKTKGLVLTKINGNNIDTILNKFLSIEPSDGYNITSKYDWIETEFSKYYLHLFEAEPKTFNIELINPTTNQVVIYESIPSLNYKKAVNHFQKLNNELPNIGFKEASAFVIDTLASTAILTINSFNTSDYKNGRNGFKDYLNKTFKTITENKTQNLIIDIRKNEGGNQGMEDYLLSHLIDKPYTKYSYVEIPSFTYSFLEYTDYKNESSIIKQELEEDFYLNKDGRYLNKEGHYAGALPKPNNFKGKIFILINGLTFSGGSEFAALAKNYTDAIFIGEETGGGYYGNTSGNFLKFTLPNSQLTGRIPLCKFVVETKDFNIPFGRGVIPNYKVEQTYEEYITGIDSQLEYTLNLISNGK